VKGAGGWQDCFGLGVVPREVLVPEDASPMPIPAVVEEAIGATLKHPGNAAHQDLAIASHQSERL
jgi:hypothetical protein